MAIDIVMKDWLSSYFGDKVDGYLVDIGAGTGRLGGGSHSYEYIKKGWSGLLVDVLEENYQSLELLYGNNDKVNLRCLAVSDTDGSATLYPCDSVTTIEKYWAEACSSEWAHVKYGDSRTVQTKTLASLLKEIKAPRKIDLLKIDTEGHDFNVLKGMDWSYIVDIVCFETLDMRCATCDNVHLVKPEVHEYLTALGFSHQLNTNGGNAIYRRRG